MNGNQELPSNDRNRPYAQEEGVTYIYETTSDLLEDYIQPSASVGVIGPNLGLLADPTLAYACNRIATGKIYVVEPQMSTNKSGVYVAGVGGWDAYLNDIRVLQRLGIQQSEPIWCGAGVGVQNMEAAIAPQTLDVIIDHGTSPYLVDSTAGRQNAFKYTSIYRQYFEALVPGGRVVLSIPSDLHEQQTLQESRAALTDIGFIAETHALKEDSVNIPVSERLAEAWRQSKRTADRSTDLGAVLRQSVVHHKGIPALNVSGWYKCKKAVIAYRP